MSNTIHPTAIVEDAVTLGNNVSIGAYSHVSGKTHLGDNVVLKSHVVVAGTTTIGEGTHIYPFASIGHAPQDLKYDNEETSLEVGAYNRIREHVTINRGTEGGGGITRIGDHGLFMNGTHIAHDCMVGNHVICASNCTLAGHVTVGDFAILGGLAAVHQFCRIGAHAFLGGGSKVRRDVIPYAMVTGNFARLEGLNLVGLRRRDFSRETIKELRAAYQDIFTQSEGTLSDRANAAAEKYSEEATQYLAQFILTDQHRGYCMPDGADKDD